METYEDELAILEAEVGRESPFDPLDDIALLSEDAESKRNPENMLLLLHHPDKHQRIQGARAFCEIEDARAIPFLIGMLADPCPQVRVNTAYALGRNTSPLAVEPLIAQFNRDWNGFARKGIVWALGNTCDARAIETLADALQNDISAVRLWAASALGQTPKIDYDSMIKAVPALIRGLRRDDISSVRSNCAWAIGQICAELPSNVVYATAIDALIEAFAEDEEFGVKEDARAAILSVGDSRGLQVIEEIEQDGYF
ncbi:MAG: HEAT repeat domain-containing protein [Phormidesmis sp. RL_2_1]|nr:HEAT repeat domain-containing protein [Phormidesmis sp. RL_2_1]